MMRTYLITGSSNTDEIKISTEIKKYPKWAQISPSAYLVQSNKKAAEIRDELLKVSGMNGNSMNLTKGIKDVSVLVIKVTSEWATSCMDKEVTKWMHENM